MRNDNTGGNTLWYNTITKEITYNESVGKTFVIPHPIEPETKYLVHACLEGPEAGVYYRGKGEITNGKSVKIELPNYVDKLAKNFTINLTLIYNGNTENVTLYTSDIENSSFYVYGPNCKFHWVVYGERNKIDVEPNIADVEVKGNGPYLYISK